MAAYPKYIGNYEISYMSPGTYSLEQYDEEHAFWQPLFNYSKRLSYLKQKMREHRKERCLLNASSASYRIVDFKGNPVFCKEYALGESESISTPYHKTSPNKKHTH